MMTQQYTGVRADATNKNVISELYETKHVINGSGNKVKNTSKHFTHFQITVTSICAHCPTSLCCIVIFSVKLHMSVNPVGSMSLVGETVHLCCQAAGSPAPDYYEW